jgi:hypothetical protein
MTMAPSSSAGKPRRRGPSSPATIPILPEPVKMLYLHTRGDEDGTTIFRRFRREDVPRCRLCPHCRADADGECMVYVNAIVPESACATFDLGQWLAGADPVGEPPGAGDVATAAGSLGLAP